MRLGRILTAFVVLLFGFVAVSPAYSAAAYTPLGDACSTAPNSATCQGRGNGSTNPLTGTNGTIMRIINIISVVGGVAAVIILVVTGIRMAASQGDAKTISETKKAIIAVLVGLVVLGIARLLVSLIVKGVM